MSDALPIARSSRRLTIPAAAAQTVFSFAGQGPLWDPADLVVERKVSPAGGFTAITTGFTKALVNDGDDGATVTFDVAPRPTSGDAAVDIRLTSKRVHERETDVGRAGKLHTPSLEAELDKQTTALQELRRDVDQGEATAVRVPDGETAQVIPAAGARADKALGFNAFGDAVALPTTGHVPGIDTVTDNKVAAPPSDDLGVLLSKLSVDAPSGASLGRKRSALKTLVRSTYIDQFDIDFSGAASSFAAIQQAVNIAAASAQKTLVLDNHALLTGQRIIIPAGSGLRIVGENAVLKAAPSAVAPDTLLYASGHHDLRIQALRIEGNDALPVEPGNAPQATFFHTCDNLRFEDTLLFNHKGIGLALVNCIEPQVTRNRFLNMGEDVREAPDPAGAVSTMAIWCGLGSRYARILDNSFKTCWSNCGLILADHSIISRNVARDIGEGAWYSENVDPAGNGGVTPAYNLWDSNVVDNTILVAISACGFEVTTPYTTLSNNIILNADTHGIACGIGSHIKVSGNQIHACNKANAYSNVAGIIARVGVHPQIPAVQQGRDISITDNVISDERNLCNFGIYWYNDATGTHRFRNPQMSGNKFFSIKDRDIWADVDAFDETAGTIQFANNGGWPDRIGSATNLNSTNSVTTQTLKSITIPAASMLSKQGYRIEADGDFANANDAKTIDLVIDGVVVGTLSSSLQETWGIVCDIVNTSATAQRVFFRATKAGVGQPLVIANRSFNTRLPLVVSIAGNVVHTGDFARCTNLTIEKKYR